MASPPRVLVIAGSDCSGGAGIEADSRVLAVHNVYAMTATTALTVQNTLGVQSIIQTPPDVVARMIRANLDDIGCDVIKIGMLASARTVEVVATALESGAAKYIVLDPVMVSTSGAQLLPKEAVRNLRQRLIPISTILTPNIPEALLLLGDAGISYKDPANVEDLKTLAQQVHHLGARFVLLKGGHIPLNKSYNKASTNAERELTVDVICDGDETTVIESPYSHSKNTHGTGCSLASAIAANIAHGHSAGLAITLAIRFVAAGIQTAPESFGRGSGPINHFHSHYHLPFSPGRFIEYLLSRPDIAPAWQKYTHHPFTTALAMNILPLAAFKNYLIQDYLYLTHFARSHAVAAYKSTSISSIAAAAATMKSIETEMALHLSYCCAAEQDGGFGLSRAEIESNPESQACVAYSRFVLDIGLSQDWLALQIVMLPCLLGYQETARRILKAPYSVRGDQGNRYWRWVENYTSAEYDATVDRGRKLVEEHVVSVSPKRIEELANIFVRATDMEYSFWNSD